MLVLVVWTRSQTRSGCGQIATKCGLPTVALPTIIPSLALLDMHRPASFPLPSGNDISPVFPVPSPFTQNQGIHQRVELCRLPQITPFQYPPNGSMAQLNGHAPAVKPQQPDTAYTFEEQPLGTARHVRIVGIGAGASGLNMIRTLRLNLSNYDIVVYEKNADVGGTWFENRYPGCRCDVPSHSYQFSWRPKKDWTNFFAAAEEIEEYLCKICDEERMRDSIKTSHQVVSARWNEKDGLWELVVRNLETGEEFSDHATFLVNGTGILK